MEIIVEKPENLSPCCDSWQQIMKKAVRDSETLLKRVGLSSEPAETSSKRPKSAENQSEILRKESENQFPVFVPEPLLKRIEPGNPNDPILKQVLAIGEESDSEIQSGYSLDPLKELSVSADTQSGIIKKYNGRALLMTTGACGVHCRYCFRRHFPYQELPKNRVDWTEWLDAIQKDPTIKEVILSGGDPLVLTDSSLKRLSEGLSKIDHARWIRIHSRMPVVIPQRVTPELATNFSNFQVKTFVIHCNHSHEIDSEVKNAVKRLKEAGWQILNQAVLLKGVNDDLETLTELSTHLLESGVQPYYLHQLDPVYGAAHFQVSTEEGKELIQQMRTRLPGHAVPRFVVELAGEPNKTILE